MNPILKNLGISVVIAIVVYLGCVLLGGILSSFNIPIATVIGGFLKTYATIIGFLSGLWWFFTHS